MKTSFRVILGTALSLVAIGSSAPNALGQDNDSSKTEEEIYQQVNSEADQAAVEPAFDDSDFGFYSADGTTAAPGGNLAYVATKVNGSGLHVDNVNVNYFAGTDLEGNNASAQQFELTWYEGGQRRAETKGPDSGWVTARQKWVFNRNIDAGPMCGRVKIDGAWTNYACVNIHP